MNPRSDVLSTVTRSGHVESTHRGSVAVVVHGQLTFAMGNVAAPVYCRSAVKPLQAVPLLERGGASRLGLDGEELALMSASHNGTEYHVGIARRLLARGGFTGDDLQCGPHLPIDAAASRAITAAGGKPERIHNNCSGKHAGFLLLAADLGVAAADYLDPDRASQRLVRETVAEMAELPAGAVDVGLDGCGAPTLRLPLENLARAFANLTNPEALAPVRARACRALLEAITDHPVALAGEGRICTALIRSAPGRIYGKNGAEGVYAFGLPGRHTGVAIKVDDGAERGYLPVVVESLLSLGLWEALPDTLESFRRVPIRNTRKEIVGHVASAISWPDSFEP